MSFMDTLRKRAEMVRSWRRWSERIAEAVGEVAPEAEVYVFGSVVRGEAVGGSDVDILIIVDKLPRGVLERAETKESIVERAGLPYYHPFQIHLVTREEAESYFERAGDWIIKIR